jgi:Kef-type K+ transport system membrane component KefB/nucleotide-binding universal stress UspA family protein
LPGALAVLVLTSGFAFAAEGGKANAPSEVIFLVQLIVLMLVGRLLGEGMNRIGQPSVMGMLLAGVLLGPTALGALSSDLQQALFPKTPAQKAMLDGVAQFGILLLLLLTGMETDLKLVRRTGRAALSISLTGVAVPFACGFALGELMPEYLLPHPEARLLTALFLGTALSISSIKIVAAIVREMGFMRRNLGLIIVASAICEDSIGWVIIAIIFGLAEAGTIDPMSVGRSVLGTAAFLIASFAFGRRLVFFLIRWANDNFTSEFPVITMILVIMGSTALITHFLGVHTVLGAFVAGVLVGESPILGRHIEEQLRGLISAFFMPVFFGTAGLSADLTVLKDPTLALFTLGLIAIASVGKFVGAFVGGAIGGLTRHEALAIACGMNARGSTEVIVASIGLSMGALSPTLFTMVLTMAVITTLAMPPMLRWGLSRVPIGRSEEARLEREEFEAKGWLPNLERLLVVSDESANGKLAARLAGLIAGPRGLPVTLLSLPEERRAPSLSGVEPAATKTRGSAEESGDHSIIAAAAETSRRGEEAPTGIQATDVTVRAVEEPVETALTTEAKKGYDVLLLGMANTRTPSGEFHGDVARVMAAFEGPVVLTTARAAMLGQPELRPLDILVPVSGTDVSRRAIELAIAIARPSAGRITALYVAKTGATQVPDGHGFASRREEQAILADVVAMGERYDVRVDGAIHSEVAPDAAILTAAKEGRHDLIIMGVNRRPGEKLFFGDTAAAVFAHAPRSLILVAT